MFYLYKQYTVYSLVQIYSSWSDSPPDGSRVELLEHEIEQSIWNPDRYFNEVVWHLDELEFELKDSIAHPEYDGRPSMAQNILWTSLAGLGRRGTNIYLDLWLRLSESFIEMDPSSPIIRESVMVWTDAISWDAFTLNASSSEKKF